MIKRFTCNDMGAENQNKQIRFGIDSLACETTSKQGIVLKRSFLHTSSELLNDYRQFLSPTSTLMVKELRQLTLYKYHGCNIIV